MPASSETQRKFMWLVHGLQKGKVSPEKVGAKVTKAANSMNSSDVKDFLMQECGLKECGMDAKRRILTALKELQEPMNLQEDEPAAPNPIATTKTFHGDYDDTLKMYRGFELTPKENQAIQNFDEAQPVLHDKFKVQYSKTDDFTNNSTITVKKLREPNGKYVYVALVKVRAGEDKPEEPAIPDEPTQSPEQPPLKEESGDGDEIKIVKSSAIDDQEGSEILTNFLQAVYHNQA